MGACFLPLEDDRRAEIERLVEDAIAAEGQTLVGWRDVPVDFRFAGTTAAAIAPAFRQVVVGSTCTDQDAFERKLYVIRRLVEKAAGPELVDPEPLVAKRLVYKGMLTAPQLAGFYPDLTDPRFESALALIHSRFSTNTFPSWALAHPYRLIAHNGEINTLRGNVNWMRARESQLASELFGDDLAKVLPVIHDERGSDTAVFDNVLELLLLGGRSIQHAMMMMIPEAYEGRDDISAELKGFYAYHQCLMEAWDGPAAIAFTDGRVIGATLDRNGLRPGRWFETADGWVVLGVGDGRARGRSAERRAPRPPPARQAVPRRPRRASHRPRRGGEADDLDATPVRRVGRHGDRAPRRPAARTDAGAAGRSRCAAASSCSATRRRT